jgi:hypothetical protein
MIRYRTTILKFDKKGEKTGWSYIVITQAQAIKLKAERTSFRVKGKLDQVVIERTAVIPMGDGDFILPVNGTLRKKLGKQAGDSLVVELVSDDRPLQMSSDFMKCLKDDPRALAHFKTLPKSHQNYFSKWIESAKTIQTKTRRITMAVIALGAQQGYGEMIRANKSRPTL